MIKVGIVGADTADAGELLRIIIHHPEVDVVTLFAPSMAGRQVSSCHHGFIGEKIQNFTDKISPSKLDAIFVADNSEAGREIIDRAGEWPDLRVIDLSPSRFDHWDNLDMEYGLSEINRKPLVRGARMAIIPTPASSLALVALHPLALNLLLSSDLDIIVEAPKEMADDIDAAKTAAEIARQLRKIQTGFEGSVTVRIEPADTLRAMRVKTVIKCPHALPEVEKIYESVYDDHNFTFTSLSPVAPEEVEGTQKCVISFCKPGAGLLEIDAVADGRMRGGAGDAMHMLNLLFSLHEKVGLHLKPSLYGGRPDVSSRQTSWFA